VAVVLAILSCCGLGCAYSLSQISPFQIQPPAVSREAQGHLSKLQSCSCSYICHWHHWLAQLRLVGHFSCVEAGQWLCWALEFCSYIFLIICIPHCCLETLSRDVPPPSFFACPCCTKDQTRSEGNMQQNILSEFLSEYLFCGSRGEMCQGHAQHCTAVSSGGFTIFIDIFHAKYSIECSCAEKWWQPLTRSVYSRQNTNQ